MKTREANIEEIAELIHKEYLGTNAVINGLGLCNRDTEYDSIISYIESESFFNVAFNNSKVKALILTEDIYYSTKEDKERFSYIIVDHPEDVFYKLHELLYEQTNFYQTNLAKPTIGVNCNIHKTVCIEDGVLIGNNVTIGANSVINKNVIIGNNVHIGCCSVIGSEGFQILRNKRGVPYNVKHVGGTIIRDNVWVGDNVTICNSLFEGSVQIGDNTHIDNHSYIAHNCILGENNVLTAGTKIMGSSKINNNCWIAPNSTILNRLIVDDYAFVGANSLVNRNVNKDSIVVGSPAIPIHDFRRYREYLKKTDKN